MIECVHGYWLFIWLIGLFSRYSHPNCIINYPCACQPGRMECLDDDLGRLHFLGPVCDVGCGAQGIQGSGCDTKGMETNGKESGLVCHPAINSPSTFPPLTHRRAHTHEHIHTQLHVFWEQKPLTSTLIWIQYLFLLQLNLYCSVWWLSDFVIYVSTTPESPQPFSCTMHIL